MAQSSLEFDAFQQRLYELPTNVFEYLLIISPDESTIAALIEVKKNFKALYGCNYSANLTPHITLVNFLQLEENEKYFINCFDRVSKSVNEFNIELNGFNGFPKHTIYVDLVSKKPIVDIVKRLRSNFNKFLTLTNMKPSFTLNPHLTIARQMTEVQFEQAWTEWNNREFDSPFLVNEMKLLKRNVSGGRYTTVASFPFVSGKTPDEQLVLPF